MAEVYLGEIRLFPYNRLQNAGWHVCDGTILPVAQNQALYSVIGTQFGGTPGQNFALPDLRGRTPFGLNSQMNPAQGTKQGVESVTLTAEQLPPHAHSVNANAASGDSLSDVGTYLAANAQGPNPLAKPFNVYAPASSAPLTSLHTSTVAPPVGSGQPHDNNQPSLALVYCIATIGLYPQRA